MQETIRDRLYDLPGLLALRRTLRRVGRAAQPRAEQISGPNPSGVRRLGLLPGSFNPLTLAHTALAEAGLADAAVDVLLFTPSTSTVDKEDTTGAALEDRLLVLRLYCERDPRLGVLLVNRGLYVDQARLVRATFPRVRELLFLIGFDKIVQILDPRYYADRDAALERLFGLAGFLVAPRGSDGPAELEALLARPENRRFAGAVRPLDLPPELRLVASSLVREAMVNGAILDHHLPLEARAFVRESGAYDPAPPAGAGVDRYRVRLDVLEALEASGRDTADGTDFRTLVARAISGRL